MGYLNKEKSSYPAIVEAFFNSLPTEERKIPRGIQKRIQKRECKNSSSSPACRLKSSLTGLDSIAYKVFLQSFTL